MHTLQFFKDHQDYIEEKLGYKFQDKHLLETAFIHKSFINENESFLLQDNERLEFLGDAVLDLIVAGQLFELLPGETEGRLSDLRSRLVDKKALGRYLTSLGLETFLVLGKGERKSSQNTSIFANLFEAIIGAIYLDGGFFVVKEFFLNHFSFIIQEELTLPTHNSKALLQDYVQKTYGEKPIYEIVSEMGSDHEKKFLVVVKIDGLISGEGQGFSKKEAEKNAAVDALKKINEALTV